MVPGAGNFRGDNLGLEEYEAPALLHFTHVPRYLLYPRIDL